MSENKLDRANLRRQARRVESYKSLISRQRSTLKNNSPTKNLNYLETAQKAGSTQQCSSMETEDEQSSKMNHISSPGSSTSGSSDSSQDFQPNLCTSLKAIQKMPHQSEWEMSSVMTRSATRKYATVGAIHNRVDIDKELRAVKLWPSNVSYPIPMPPDEAMQLRDVVTRSFSEVLTFCRTAIVLESKEPQTVPADSDLWTSQETAERFIDLSPYLTQEPSADNGSDENRITFHLNEDYIAHPFVNIIALNEEDQEEETLVIHEEEEEEEYETITLHSGETYLVENKYLSNTTNSEFNTNHATTFSADDPMTAIYNDHTYAARPNENVVKNTDPVQKTPHHISENTEFKLENALKDLLLNTAVLKCLICNETPQEIMTQLDIAQSYLYSENDLY